MKKILSGLLLLSFLFVLAVPMMASAGMATGCTIKNSEVHDAIDDCPAAGASCTFETDPECGVCCMLDAIYTATDWVFVGIMALVIIFILIGGFYILTAAGAPERVASGRQFIVWACIGLAVALGAKAIPAIVKALLGI